MNLDQATTREEIIEVFEGLSGEPLTTADGLVKPQRPLVKSYMLETVPEHRTQPSLADLFRRVSHRIEQVDVGLHKVVDSERRVTVGVVEQLMDRHPVYYTTAKSDDSDRLVRRLVDANPDLDHLWISGLVFDQLFRIVCELTPPHRFGRMVFQHTSLFELEDQEENPQETTEEAPDNEMDEPDAVDEDYVFERRATKFSMVERLGEMQEKLPGMRKLHAPMYAISQLRFPSAGRGGHDFYHHGKVTNRSRSFGEHRQKIEYVLGLYKVLTEQTERKAWQSVEHTPICTQGHSSVLAGAPVVLEFSQPLPQPVFEQFIRATFRYENNRFRLWGNPIRLGPTKVHVYGVDRHVWQEIFLEITEKRIVAIVPYGTCGNSVHRLITNVQHYLDPAVKAWIGDTEYDTLITSVFNTKKGGPHGKGRR